MTEHGMRMAYKGHIGTVKFIGPVEGTSGTWLGIEWDDPTRGKHDGSKDGKRYFTCLVPGAGSFLRPSADICYGKSFLAALRAKYVEAQHGSESQELVILGSSQGAIQVEAVNLDKIREKLSNLSLLREVSLDGEMVASSETPGSVHDVCPNIRGLDLSKSLIHSWDTVTAIARELPFLQKLYTNRNRFQLPINADSKMDCFNSLTELRLNNTLMLWRDIIKVIAAMPKLQDLEIGYNRLINDSFGSAQTLGLNTPVRAINLESNEISGWEGICGALLELPFLERVILANNRIETIPFPTSQRRMLQLKSLSLSYNGLKVWSDLSALAAWAPSLESLTLNGNPIIIDHVQSARPLTLARWATLKILDGAAISAKERRDAELYYISYIVNHGPKSEEERYQEYPRWQDLREQYGAPDEKSSTAVTDTLQSRLLELSLYQSSAPTSPDHLKECLKEGNETVIRVLPTMTLKNLRSKVRKTLGLRGNKGVTMFMVMNDCAFYPLEEDRNDDEIDWIGLQNHSQILCFLK